ncbi:MAG TPA: S8 family serine peptidase [Candidatus Thermoplasmatota archaeon]|nr:S8 family serine peptidase [Candidatus Thermoplasmatota archaeon]
MTRGGALLLTALLAFPLFSGCFGGIASDWAFKMTGLRAVQEKYDGSGMLIAIIDTGINLDHPSMDHLKGRVIWRDEVNNKPDPYDDVGHGTHVAGIIAGDGASFGGKAQGFNLKGGAPKADLIVVKAIGSNEKGDTTDVVSGIRFAISNKADVICLSLGSHPTLSFLPSEMQGPVDDAVNQGIMVVASAGNYRQGEERPNDVSVPARLEMVVAVGAVDQGGAVAEFSVRGDPGANNGVGPVGLGARRDPNKKPEVVAPGVDIRSAFTGDDFARADGTSQAAPFVCSAFALLMQKCTKLRAANTRDTVASVKQALMQTTEPVKGQSTPHDNGAGYGLLKADKLLAKFGETC